MIPGYCNADRYAPLVVELEADELQEMAWQIDCPTPVAPGLYFTRWTESAGQRIMRANLEGTGAVPVATPVIPERAALNPSRTRLAFLADNPDYGKLWMADGNGTHARSTGLDVTDFDWSPDGRMLVATTIQTSPRTALALYWPDGNRIRTLHEAAGFSSVRWAPSGTRVAVKESHYIYIYDVETGTRTSTLQLLGPLEQPIAWSPDGSRLAYVHNGRLWSMAADGSDLTELQDDAGPEGVDWSSTGTLIFTRTRFVQSHESVLFTTSPSGGSLTESPAYLAGAIDDRPRWAP
jgi:dipeptidyl aminopeptidase/acylaminoacyl peptidase